MDYFEQLIEQSKEGFESPLKAYIEISKEMNRLELLQDKIKQSAIQEAANEPEAFERYGAKVNYMAAAGSRWDFSNIEDWKDLKKQREDLEAKHKAAYHAWKRGDQYVDESGEVIPPAAYVSGNSTISLSYKGKKKKK
jgi:hypothetical protein